MDVNEHRTDHGHTDGSTHGHAHGAALEGGWVIWREHPVMRVVLAAVAGCAVLTLAGLAMLWPDGRGQEAVSAEAAAIGLASDRYGAVVDSVVDANCSYQGTGAEQVCRTVTVTVTEGPDRGAIVVLPEFNLSQPGVGGQARVGDELIVGFEPTTDFYFFADRDRRPLLTWLSLAFVIVVVVLGRMRGAMALVSMAMSVVVLVGFVAPAVLDGNDPLMVCLVAASLIAFASLYLTHGVSPTTTVALAGTLGALVFTLAISSIAFAFARFSGLASDEAITLPIVAGDIDLVGLLLGGAMIGALGALDDVTVTQVATVAELRRQRPDLSVRQLTAAGVRVGREHIASTVNTLLLAYAGAAMPLLLLFAISDQSIGMIANSEVVAIEIVRTLCGSMGLVAATPLTTVLAAIVVAGREVSPDSGPDLPTGMDAPAETRPAPQAEVLPADVARWEDFAPRDDAGF
ncbi:MAG: YibE/F family protein [Acidimicrobiales bacterium]